MAKEDNISLNFKLRKTNEIKNYFIQKIKHNDLMCKKHKNVCMAINYHCTKSKVFH